jgi:hypothetical protein
LNVDFVVSNPGKYEGKLANNEARIKDIRSDLNQYEKNPHYYRNRKILAVAGTVALIAAVAIVSYFTLGSSLPFFVGMVGVGGQYSLTTIVGVFGSLFSLAPLAGLIAIPRIHERVWSTPEKDQISVKQIEEDNKQLKADLQKEISSNQHSLQLYQKATADSFSETAWNATVTLFPSLKLLTTPEKQKAAWLNRQVDLSETREGLYQNIQDLERQLKKFAKIDG